MVVKKVRITRVSRVLRQRTISLRQEAVLETHPVRLMCDLTNPWRRLGR